MWDKYNIKFMKNYYINYTAYYMLPSLSLWKFEGFGNISYLNTVVNSNNLLFLELGKDQLIITDLFNLWKRCGSTEDRLTLVKVCHEYSVRKREIIRL